MEEKQIVKIMVVAPTLRGGGAERVVSILTKEWAKFHQVTVVLFDASDTDYGCGGRIVDIQIPASKNFLRKIFNVGARSVRLMSIIQRECPDRVISFMESANLPAIAAAALTGYLDKLYVSVHCNPKTLSFPYQVLLPLLYRFSAGGIAVSEGVKRNLVSLGLPAGRISAIPNPVVCGDKQVKVDKSVSPMSARFLLGVGRLHQVKGFDRLLQAFRRLERPELQLVILGEGAERLTLLRLARGLEVEKSVHLPGRIADVDPWYRHAECFVLSSRSEAWPNVLMEALVNGCPIVSFDVKHGPSEIIEDGDSGLLVPEGDVEALAAAIARVLDEVNLRRRLVAKGRERVQDYYVDKIAPRWLDGH